VRVLMPESLEGAFALLENGASATGAPVPIAGGTDLLVHWPDRIAEHDRTYLDLWHLAELRPIRWTDDALELGALTTYWDVVRHRRVGTEFPLLVDAARQVGAIQIQSRGTWAGNIANGSPAADGVPVLMAYDATVVMASRAGRREASLSAFYRGYKEMDLRPGELIVAIRLPRRPHSVQQFFKIGSRRAQAIAKVGAAIARSDAGWRVVAASMAPTVRRCAALERLFESGVALDGPDDLLPALREDVSPIDDLRSSAAYRERVMARVLYHALRNPGSS